MIEGPNKNCLREELFIIPLGLLFLEGKCGHGGGPKITNRADFSPEDGPNAKGK